MHQHFSVTQASLISLLTTIVGFLVAFIPTIATYQSVIIAIGTGVLGVAFLVVNAIHAHAAATVQAARLSQPAVVAPVA